MVSPRRAVPPPPSDATEKNYYFFLTFEAVFSSDIDYEIF